MGAALKFEANIFDDLIDGIVVLDGDFHIQYFNNAFAKAFALTPRQVKRAKVVWDLIAPPEAADLQAWLTKIRPTHSEFKELTISAALGHAVSAQVTAQHLENGHWVLFFRDLSVELTLQRKYHAQLEHMREQNTRLELFAFTLLCAIMGGSYLASRYCVETVPPVLAGAVRCLIPGLVIILGYYLKRDNPTRSEWREALWMSVVRRAVPQGAITWSVFYIPSGLASLLVSTTPLWLAVIDSVFGEKKPGRTMWMGVFFGVAGLGLVALDSFGGRLPLWPMMVLVAAMIINAGATYHQVQRRGDLIRIMGVELALGGLVLLVLSFFLGELDGFRPSQVSEKSLLALVYLTVFAGLLAQVAMVWIMSVRSAVHGSSFLFVVPVIGLTLGFTVGRESLHMLSLAACALLLLSVRLVRRGRQ